VLKLIDFGYSEHIHNKRISYGKGTIDYVAPEVIKMEPRQNHCLFFDHDVFSIGGVIYAWAENFCVNCTDDFFQTIKQLLKYQESPNPDPQKTMEMFDLFQEQRRLNIPLMPDEFKNLLELTLNVDCQQRKLLF
jgi:serine/threonine protein kinase